MDAKITIEYGRRVPLADYDSVSVSAMLTIPADFNPDQIQAALETANFALNEVRERVEAAVAAKMEAAAYDREFQHLQSAMLKRHVPPEDMAEALAVIGLGMPVTSYDTRACAQAVMALNAETIPMTWVWFRDGKHPHPHAPKMAEGGLDPALDPAPTEALAVLG